MKLSDKITISIWKAEQFYVRKLNYDITDHVTIPVDDKIRVDLLFHTENVIIFNILDHIRDKVIQ